MHIGRVSSGQVSFMALYYSISSRLKYAMKHFGEDGDNRLNPVDVYGGIYHEGLLGIGPFFQSQRWGGSFCIQITRQIIFPREIVMLLNDKVVSSNIRFATRSS